MSNSRASLSAVRHILQTLFALFTVAVTTSCDSLLTKPSLYGTVRVHVLRRDNSPIPGAPVLLYAGARPMGYAFTDGTGAVVFTDVPYGVYGVRATPPAGYLEFEKAFGGPDSGYRDQLFIVGGDLVDAQFNFLKDGQGLITARIREADGRPVVNNPVTLYTSAGELERGVTDATGAYTFAAVPLGNYGVFAPRAELYLDSAETDRVVRDGLLIEAGSRDTADYVYERCAGSVNAQVRDNRGGQVPGALLTLYRGSDRQNYTLTDSSTRLFTALPCGQYGVRVQPPAGYTVVEGFGTSYRDQLQVHRNSSVPALLTVTRIGRGSIRARIVDDAGVPIGNTRVVLYTGATVLQDVFTDGMGVVTFPDLLVNAQYGVRAVPRAGYNVREGFGLSYFDGINLTDGTVRDLLFTFRRD